MDLVAPPDVEVAVVAALAEAMPDVHVSTRYPTSEPPLVVRVSTNGGEVTGLVHATYRVLVECWGDDEGASFALAARTYAHLTAMGGRAHDVTVYRVDAALPTNFPDVNRLDRFRFQFVATVYCRMEALS